MRKHCQLERKCFPSWPDHYLTNLSEATFITSMVMEGVEGGGLGHGILRTFMRDESGGGKKITPIKIITERGGGFESMQRKN